MAIRFGGQSQQRWGDNTLNTNEFMRDLLLMDIKGVSQSTAAARKKGMVVLAFFDPADPDCQKTLPVLQRLADAYKESGKLTVLAVSQGDPDATRAFAERYGITFPLMPDTDNYYTLTYGVSVVPTVFLADGAGMVTAKVRGHKPEALNGISAQVAKFAEVETVDILQAASVSAAAAAA
jgi:Peroxiredoxin